MEIVYAITSNRYILAVGADVHIRFCRSSGVLS